MRTSNIIKRSLGDNEQTQFKFTLSNEYIRINFTASILKWFLIISTLTGVLFFLLNYNNNQTNENNNEYFNYQGMTLEAEKETASNNWIIWTAVIFFFLIVIPVLGFYHLYYLRISNEYFFTNQRILIKKGWISTKTISIHYNRITDISVTQNMLDRILRIGTMAISTAGSEGYEVTLKHISKPYLLKKRLFSLKEQKRNNSAYQAAY